MSAITYQFIKSTEDLECVCQLLATDTHIAIDTEFLREKTFYPKPGLIQIADRDNIYLIDPLSCQMTSFIKLLENPHIMKVMHSMSEDLEVFWAMGLTKPNNFFDTQIAATWLGAGLSLSLQNLVLTHKQVELSKSHTRTNWLARPLSDEQLNYAAEDVLYLLEIAEQQQTLLKSAGFIDYVVEDNKLALIPSDDSFEMSYLNYGRAARFDHVSLNRFQRLVAWRESTARRDDKPKPHILKDADLSSIVTNYHTKELLNKYPFHPVVRKRYLNEIAEIVFAHTDKDLPPVKRLQDISGGKQLMAEIKTEMLILATQNRFPEEVLPSKRLLEQFIKHLYFPWYPSPKQWSGWRKSFIIDVLDNLGVEIKPI